MEDYLGKIHILLAFIFLGLNTNNYDNKYKTRSKGKVVFT